MNADERYLAYTQGSCIVVQEVASAATQAVLNPDFQSGHSPAAPQLAAAGDMELTFRPDGALRISNLSRYTEGYFPPAGLASVRVWDWRNNRTPELQERQIVFSADPQPEGSVRTDNELRCGTGERALSRFGIPHGRARSACNRSIIWRDLRAKSGRPACSGGVDDERFLDSHLGR